MLVNLSTFKGQNKAIPSHQLPLEVGQYANNLYIEDGRFVPMYCTSLLPASPSFTGTEQTIYQHRNINANTKKWFTSDYWTQVVRHPNGSDEHQRIYFVEDNRPKYKLYSDSYVYDLLLPLVDPQDQLTVGLTSTGDITSTLVANVSTQWAGAQVAFNCPVDVNRVQQVTIDGEALTQLWIDPVLGQAPAVGNSLIAIVSIRDPLPQTVVSIEQTGITWELCERSTNTGTVTTVTEIWVASNISATSNDTRITFSESVWTSVAMYEYTGILTKKDTSFATGTGTTATIGTIAINTYTKELHVGGVSLTNSTHTLSQSTGSFTVLDTVSTNNTDVAVNSKLYTLEYIASPVGTIRRFIAYTLVTDYGDESALSLTTSGTGNYVYGNYFIDNLASDTNMTITWDATDILPTGGNYNSKITKIRFYMTPAESSAEGYKFIGETTIAAETFNLTDAGSDTPLLETMTTPVKLTYDIFSSTNPCISVCKTMFGALAISDKSSVYVSDVYQPATYNATNTYKVDSEITGVFPFGSSIAVFTTTVPSIFTGNNPDTLTVEKAEQARAVANIKCVVNTDDYIVFPTDEGIYVIGTGVYKLATDGVISKRQWESITGKGALLLTATHYKDQYILLLTTGVALIFDFLRGFYSQTTFANPTYLLDGNHVENTNILKVSYYDSVDQQLYGIPTGSSSNSVFVYEGSDQQLFGTFKSKRFITNKPYNMKYLRILADDFTGASITINIYYDGDLFQTVSVLSDKVYKLKSQLTREMEVEIISNVTLRNVILSDNMKELQSL